MKKNYITPEIKTVHIATERSVMMTMSNGDTNTMDGKDDLDEEWDEEELCKIFLGWDF